MKKIMVLAIAAAMSFAAVARPHGGFRGPMHHGGYHHHGSWWGRGGRNFWPSFAGGVIGSAVGGWCYRGAVVAPTVVTTPTVITTPVVTVPQVVQPVTQIPVATTVQPYQYVPVETYRQIWVPGQIVPITRPDGTVTYVRQPGHYETVRVQ